MNPQHGQEKQEKVKKEDSTRKAENLTNAKILEATLKHQAKRLEIPEGNRFALE